jgi:hypothetical protein
VIVPPGVTVPVSFPSSGYITKVIDVAGTVTAEFDIPYLYKDDFQVFGLRYNDALNPPGTEDTRLVYYQLTPPLGPAETPVYPYVNLWLSAGEDYSVGYPTMESWFGFTSGPAGISPQGGVGPQSVAKFGEVIEDLLLLTRRMGRRYTANMGAFPGKLSMPILPYIPFKHAAINTIATINQAWTFESFLSLAYFGMTGGTRFTVRPPDGNVSRVYTSYDPPGRVLALLAYNRDMNGVQFFSQEETPLYEFTVPDKNFRSFRYCGGISQASGQGPVHGIWMDLDASEEADYYSAGADDFTLGGFLAPPRMGRV